MPYRFKLPVNKDYHLEETDEKLGITKDNGGLTMIQVRECTQGDNERRNELFAEFKRTLETDGTVVITQRISFDDIRRLEVYLALAGANLEDEAAEGEEAKPLFKFKNGKLDGEEAFKKSWSKLPPFIADEIHKKVLDANPMWSANGEAPLP